MRITLLLPGLLWPARAFRDLSSDLPLPALAALLGRGRIAVAGPGSTEAWLADAFGMKGAWPAAALRLLGAGVDPGGGHWLCADPARIALTASGMPLDDPDRLALTADECAALRQALAPVFDGVPGGIVATRPGHWHLRLPGPLNLGTTPLPAAIGQDAKHLLPFGADARPWRTRLNEAQILLHRHPVNMAREAAGRPPANTLWFWGEGALSAPRTPPDPPWRSIAWNDPAAAGLARFAAVGSGPAPETWAALEARGGGKGPLLVVLEDLIGPRRGRDALAWSAALEGLEDRWFAPLGAALRAGRVAALSLVAPGDAGTLRLEAAPGDRWRFWRRPLPLAALADRLQ